MTPNRRYSRSSSFIVAVTSAIILAVASSILAYFLYLFGNTDFVRETRAAIAADIENMQDWYDLHGIKEVIQIINRRTEGSKNHFYALVDTQGKPVAGNLKALPVNPMYKFGLLKFEVPHTELALKDVSKRSGSIEYDVVAQIHTFDNGYRLLVGRDIDDIEITQEMVGFLAWICLGVLVLIMLANFLLSLYVVKRVNHIAATAGQIMQTGDLSRRITIDTQWDDLSYLASMLNHMLSSIEKLVETVKQVSDNIAHDLRSPLTRLQHHIEQIPSDQPFAERDRQKLLKETGGLLTMFNGLLRIAEVESGKHGLEMQSVDITCLIQDAVELFEPVAQEKNVQILTELTPQIHRVDRDLMFQALINLIENAIKFTPSGGTITIFLDARDGKTCIRIADTGVGISDAEKPKVFRRLYRGETSRHTPGYGLGLSLVKAVIEYHQGALFLEDNTPRGLNVTILL
jgi:signal transduction histidine kinase